jgi:hypothetical protein
MSIERIRVGKAGFEKLAMSSDSDNSESVRAILNNISFKSPDGKPLNNVDANVNGTILSNSWKEFRFNTPVNKSDTLIIKSSFGDFEVPYKK